MANHLVWVPAAQRKYLGDLDESLEIADFPDDPLADPRIAEVEVVVARIGAHYDDVFPKMTALRLVQTMSAGVDSIIDSVPEHLTLCCARGATDPAVSEWTLAAILSGVHRFPELRDEQSQRLWTRMVAAKLLRDSTVLFVGYGSIAQATEELLKPFGSRILRVARHARPDVLGLEQLPDLLKVSDVVVLLLPLTKETRKMVDATFLGQMADGALLVNASRGAIVDTDALIAACTAGSIRAVVDVTDPEPLPEGHPLFSTPGVFVTPHVAGITTQGPAAAYRVVTDQLNRYARSEPLLHIVTDGY